MLVETENNIYSWKYFFMEENSIKQCLPSTYFFKLLLGLGFFFYLSWEIWIGFNFIFVIYFVLLWTKFFIINAKISISSEPWERNDEWEAQSYCIWVQWLYPCFNYQPYDSFHCHVLCIACFVIFKTLFKHTDR